MSACLPYPGHHADPGPLDARECVMKTMGLSQHSFARTLTAYPVSPCYTREKYAEVFREAWL